MWPLNKDLNRCAYYWPKGRRVVVSEHDAMYYETRYCGQIAYLEKSKCIADSEPVKVSLDSRMQYLIGGEEGRLNSRYFDNAQDAWSEAFIESMIMAAGVSQSELAGTEDLEQAIIAWVADRTSTRFFFWDVEIKRAFKARYPDKLYMLSDTISSTEMNYKPAVGRLLYFLDDADRLKIGSGGRLASYVGIVTQVTTEQFDMMYVASDGGPAQKATFPMGMRDAVGIAGVSYSYIAQTQLP